MILYTIYYIHHLAGTAPKYFALTCCGCQRGVHGHLGRQRAIGAGLHGQRAAGVEAIPAKPQSEGAEPGVWCRLFGIFLGPRLWKTGGTIEVSDLSRDIFLGKLSEASSRRKNIRNPGKGVNVWATQNRVETKNVENLQLSSKQKCQKIQGRCAPKDLVLSTLPQSALGFNWRAYPQFCYNQTLFSKSKKCWTMLDYQISTSCSSFCRLNFADSYPPQGFRQKGH